MEQREQGVSRGRKAQQDSVGMEAGHKWPWGCCGCYVSTWLGYRISIQVINIISVRLFLDEISI